MDDLFAQAELPTSPRLSWLDGTHFEVEAGPYTLHGIWADRGDDRQQLEKALRALTQAPPAPEIRLLATPFLGALGRQLCREARVSWVDLSGNAHLVGPGLYLHVEGKPNRYVKRGRPSSLFAPKSARLARWLLVGNRAPFRLGEASEATGLSPGFASKILARLLEEGYLRRDESWFELTAPGQLLDDWRKASEFEKNEIVKGYCHARSGTELTEKLALAFTDTGPHYALTGLAAAWEMTHFAAFRTVSAYVAELPSPRTLEALGFKEGARGANTWLILPRDEGVFQGATDWDGARCVSPAQVYVDLAAHAERAPEAAEALRSQVLRF